MTYYSSFTQHPDRRLRQFELGDKILLSKFNLSRLVDRLEMKGLVRRDPCPEDQRGAYVVITAAGKGTLRKMWPTYKKAIRNNFVDHFSKQEVGSVGAAAGEAFLNGPSENICVCLVVPAA